MTQHSPADNGPALWQAHWPQPPQDSHKYQRGHAVLFAAPELTGATRLASPCGADHYNAQTVLTPHAGEFARAFPEIFASPKTRMEQALEAAHHSGAVVVYKGPETLIAAPDGRCVRNLRPNPHLAVAGSGDVLAGLILGLLAQGMAPFWGACAGVWLHSECGERAGRGLIAGDLILALPAVLRAL